jgi:hypothetical protein
MATTTLLAPPAQLSDADLLAEVPRLAARERDATVALIAHLAELDARRLYRAEGCASLFTYCTQVLHLSEHAAYGRIEAARAARRYPVVLERLAEGSVTLTTVGLLAAHLTAENHRGLLEQARHKSRREVEQLIAALRPQPPVPASVRRLPPLRPALAAPLPPAEAPSVSPPAPNPAPSAAPAGPAPTPPARPPVVAPLAPERYKVQFTASAETYAKLRLAQDLLRHQIPDGDVGQVLDRALTGLVDALLKQKVAATDLPRRSRPPTPGSRHVPAAVKRAVWARDGGRCAYVSRQGRRCTERGFLEFHHVRPYAVGGPPTVENIQLRCRAHNGYEAEQVFGPWGPVVVREPGRVYATAHRAIDLTRTRSGPSWPSAGRPP